MRATTTCVSLRRPPVAGLVSAAALCFALVPGAVAADTLTDALVRDSVVDLHFRTYYFDRQNPGDVTQAAWAAGGWVGYQSGWIAELLRVGVVGYTSQRLWGPLDKDGSGLLAPEQQPQPDHDHQQHQ